MVEENDVMVSVGDCAAVETATQALHHAVPATARLGLEVVSSTAEEVLIRIPLAVNGNDKGTLFAGSSYAGLVTAGWFLAMNRAYASGFESPWAAVVDAHVHYAKAIRQDVVARAVFAEEPQLVPGARNWAKIRVSVGEALVFEGTYAVGVRK